MTNINKNTSLLFVCKGNIGRSQFAEIYFKNYGFSDVQSCCLQSKFNGMCLDEIPGTENFQIVCETLGFDVSKKKCKNYKEITIIDSTVVYILEQDLWAQAGDIFREKEVINLHFEDPAKKGVEQTTKILQDMEEYFQRLIYL